MSLAKSYRAHMCKSKGSLLCIMSLVKSTCAHMCRSKGSLLYIMSLVGSTHPHLCRSVPYYEPRVAVVLKHCQGCMRVHVCVGFVMGRLSAYFLHIA